MGKALEDIFVREKPLGLGQRQCLSSEGAEFLDGEVPSDSVADNIAERAPLLPAQLIELPAKLI